MNKSYHGDNRQTSILSGYDGGNWRFRRSDSSNWFPAIVPGNVALDLIAHNNLPPWQKDSEFRKFGQVAEKTWIYQLEFIIKAQENPIYPDQQWCLVFEGVDTFADIFLDGELLGQTRNMFRHHRFYLPEAFNPLTTHTIEIHIKPVLAEARKWARRMGVDLEKLPKAFDIHERIIARKMQMVFGWDNTPHLITGGIYGNVYLESVRNPVIKQVGWSVEAIDLKRKTAILKVLIQTTGLQDSANPAKIEIEGGCGHQSLSGILPLTEKTVEYRIPVHEAQFWWPNGMGPANLYETSIKLVAEGKVLDCRDILIGLRTIELDTSQQEIITVDYDLPSLHDEVMDGGMLGAWGRIQKPSRKIKPHNFQLRVNGKPVFIRGANWQTPDVFPAAVSAYKRHHLLQAAALANMNMIRIWGGNASEPDEFYDEAARLGLLVWQDFHFACAKYPEAPEFLEEIRLEVEEIVGRLSRHTSIAIWCGDNESDMIDVNRGDEPSQNPINKRIIPHALKQGDLQRRPYHPSSPSGGPYPRSDWEGDRRDWGAWYPLDNYIHIRQDEARFMSEGGCYAMPGISTFENYISEKNRWPLDNEAVRLHTGDLDFAVRRFDRLNFEMWKHFQAPANYKEAVTISQFAQAWGYKTLIEHHRMRKGDCGGLLLWKLNDAWPALDAGLIDYELCPRLALDFVREAYKPVAVVSGQDLHNPEQLNVALVNDTLEPVQGVLRTASISKSSEGIYLTEWKTESNPVEVEANSIVRLDNEANPESGNLLLFELLLHRGQTHHRAIACSCTRTAWSWWQSLPEAFWSTEFNL